MPVSEITIYSDHRLRVYTHDTAVAARLQRYLGPPTNVTNHGPVTWWLNIQTGTNDGQLATIAALTHSWFVPTDGIDPPCKWCGAEKRK